MNEVYAFIGIILGTIIFYAGIVYERMKWHKRNGFEE